MKVLLLSQARQIEDQPDYDASFRNAKSEGNCVEVMNIPFRGYVEKYGCDAFYREVVRANAEFKPDLVFFQFFHSVGLKDPRSCVSAIKASSHKPLVFGSLGDLFDTGPLSFMARPIPLHTLQLSAVTDAFFSTSMGDIAECLVRNGARNVIFLPNAFCPMHFPDWNSEAETDERKFDVTMLCSNGRLLSRFPLRAYKNTFRRRLIVKHFMRYFGNKFSVFGRGWDGISSKGVIPFKDQLKIYRKSRVVVDAPAPIIKTTYYSSDRAFFMLGSGTPLVHFHTPRFEKMLRANEHAYYVDCVDEAVCVCQKLLRMTEEELNDHRKKIVAFVKERHLIDHRIDTIVSAAEALKKARGKITPNADLNQIRMWHFLPEVNVQEEYKYAIGNWIR